MQYIAFAVDGAKRMQRLINDLLTFSRVGRTSEGFVAVDLAAAVATAWDGAGGRVAGVRRRRSRWTSAPGAAHVVGDPALLRLLLGNLFGNALKYRRPDEAA